MLHRQQTHLGLSIIVKMCITTIGLNIIILTNIIWIYFIGFQLESNVSLIWYMIFSELSSITNI